MSTPGNDNSEPTKVALYTRGASSGPDVQNSMGEQQRALQAYADANGTVIGVYADAGVSGLSEDPAELNRLIQDARSQPRPFDKVLVWTLDRFGRGVSATQDRITELEDLGIGIIAIQ